MPSDIENGIGDQLTWSMVGDVAASVGLFDVDASRFVPFRRMQQVFRMEASPERENRIVFEEVERIVLATLDGGNRFELLFNSVVVRNSAKAVDLQTSLYCALSEPTCSQTSCITQVSTACEMVTKRSTRLLTLWVFLIWTVLPTVCASLCQARMCCQATALPTAAKGFECPHCSHCPLESVTANQASQRDPLSCCKWIVSRGNATVPLEKISFVFESPAILSVDVHQISLGSFAEKPVIRLDQGPSPPKPIAFPIASRGPPNS